MSKVISGKTKSGFEFNLDTDVLDSYELLEAIRKVEDNPLLTVDIIEGVLGEEQKNKLIDHVRGENGRASVEKMNEEITEILQSEQLKN